MSDEAVIRLRPHHGLCLGFFEGHGYSDEFSANMARVLRSLQKETVIELAEGQDVICHSCPNRESGCPGARLYDMRVRKLCRLESGAQLTFGEFQEKIRENIIGAGKLAEVCSDCEWTEICRNKTYQS